MKKRKIISAKKDFGYSELPQTRKDQFFDILKNQYMTIFKCGIFLLLCFLPILATNFVKLLFDNGFYELYAETKITENELLFYMFFDNMVATAIEVVFFSIVCIALAGINHVVKSMIQSENVLFWSDFKIGVKENYKMTLLISIIFGIFLLLVRFVAYYFAGAYYFSVPAYTLFVLFIIPLAIISIVFSSYYQGGYFNVISNSSKLYPSTWWKFLLISIGLFGIVFGLNIGLDGTVIPYVKLVIYAFLILFLLPILILLIHSISNVMFDKYININYYPDMYLKGLYRPDEEKKERKK